MKNIIYIAFTILILSLTTNAARVKDIATISIPGEGPITNQVIGYGLVTGLNNSGDNMQTSFTTQNVISMLKRFGTTVPETNPRIRNVAAVMVTATIPQYQKRGTTVDVNISAIGNAKSLQGGVLVMCPLADQSGEVIGMAQGPLTVGGYDYEQYGARVRKNETTTGRVANGLILERDINPNVEYGNLFYINLNTPDYTTANNVAAAINAMGGRTILVDAGTVQVEVPNGTPAQQYIAQVESAQVLADLPIAKVVINERTGTIVIGGNVEITPTVIAHGGLEIVIDRYYSNHRPYNHSWGYYGSGYWGGRSGAAYPYGYGRMPKPVWNYMDTAIKKDIRAIDNYEAPHGLQYAGANVQDLVDGLRSMFVKPRDLISIFQALKASGALKAELVIQ
ncbi:MAG: flagellar basal body P-ring protein FlgI [Ignavibacteria bacterium]|jgi:flagellar P-ring protein precursor FlgI|nr:flagellar basal body P-ring protein FlgI [Ignavibacteria bacterium]